MIKPHESLFMDISLKRKASSPLKELEVVTADDLGVATVEVVDVDATIRSSRPRVI